MTKKNIIVLLIIAIIIMIAAVFSIRKFDLISPRPLSEESLITSVVDRGVVVTTVEAEGVVEAQSEVLILSPTSSIIKKVLRVPGNQVKAYQTILQLDTKPIAEEMAGIEDQLKVKRNNLHRNRLTARSTRVDLDYNVEMKKLRISSLKSEVEDQAELLTVGGISPSRFEQKKQELALAEKELEMILSKNSIRLQQLAAEEKGLELGIEIQEKQLEQKRVDSSNTTVRAPSAGIILALNGKEGEKVGRDQQLVRMSNLSAFKISGSISEEHADILKVGQTVFVQLDREKLTGKIGNINPEIQNSKVSFDIYLDESNHPKLRPNLRVSLLVVSGMKQDVLRLQTGPALDRGRNVEVYVVEGDHAFLRKLSLGMKGPEYVEVRSGVDSGEKVVISDISSFRNRPEIDFNNK
jgi:HlyD family secretion protein